MKTVLIVYFNNKSRTVKNYTVMANTKKEALKKWKEQLQDYGFIIEKYAVINVILLE